MMVTEVNILNVSCATPGTTPTFSISVATNGPAGTYFQAQLYSGAAGNLVAVGNPTAATNIQNLGWTYARQVPSGGGLVPSTTYWMVVWTCGADGGNPGPGSPPVKVVYTTVPITQVSVAGSRITLQWSYQAATSIPADGLSVQVVAGNQAYGPAVQLPLMGFVIGATPNYACSWTVDVGYPLSLAPMPLIVTLLPYTQTASPGSVSGTPGTMTGPSVSQPLFFTGPSITSAIAVVGAPTQYQLTLPNIFGTSPSVSLTPTVTANGVLVAGASLSTPTVQGQTVETTLTLPEATPIGAALAVALAQYDGATPSISSGPPGPAHTLVTASPVLSQSSFTLGATPGSVGSLSFTIDYPAASPALVAAQVSVTNAASGAVVAGPVAVAGTNGNLAVAVATGTAYNIVIQGVVGADTGPAAPPVPLLFTPPAIQSVDYDGAVVTATWTAPGGTPPAGYRLSAGADVASAHVDVTGLSAAVAVPASGSVIQVSVAPFMGAATAFGPASAGIAVPTQAPPVTAITTDPLSGLASVAWSDGSAQNAHLIQVFQNGTPLGAPIVVTCASPYQFTTAFPADAEISVALAICNTVTPATQSTAATVRGPLGGRRRVPTLTPTLLAADFDGVNASVEWTPVDGATGYNVYVVVSGVAGSTQLLPADATSASVAVSPPANASDTYQVTVQAVFGPDTGPAAAPMAIFAPGYYVAPSSPTAGTALYPATSPALPLALSLTGLASASSAVTCYLPPLSTQTVGTVATVGPFTLAANSGAGASAYPFTLTIAGGATSEAWGFSGAAFREQLQQDYVTFLLKAEAANVSPYGIWMLQQAIARALPQTFAETLFYAYGFNPTSAAQGLLTAGTVDLRPGTILRVSANAFQNVPGESGAAQSEFSGAAPLDLDVTSYLSGGARVAGFDAFIAQLAIAGVLIVDRPTIDPTSWAQPGVADAADLFFTEFQQPFYRLFMPSSLQDAWGTGSNLPVNNMALVAAQSFTLLSQSGNTGVDVPGMAKAYFGGRSVARVCIRVMVQGNLLIVPIGTTVGNALEMCALRPPSTGVALQGVTLMRSLAGMVTNPSAPIDAGAAYRVRFDWKTLAIYGFAADALDLPLLHGDVLTVRG